MSSRNLRHILNESKKAYTHPIAKKIMNVQGKHIMEILVAAEKELDELERRSREWSLLTGST